MQKVDWPKKAIYCYSIFKHHALYHSKVDKGRWYFKDGWTETEKIKWKTSWLQRNSEWQFNSQEGFIHSLPVCWVWPNSQAEDAPDPGHVRALPSEMLRWDLNLLVDPQCHQLYLEMLSCRWQEDQMNWKCQVYQKCYLCESDRQILLNP